MTVRCHILGIMACLLSLSGRAFCQSPLVLDEDCTVTVGNQTALVNPDGSFLVRNITLFETRATGFVPQLYRVRATCLRNGEMLAGQSDFFSLEPAETTFVTDVFPSELDPIPERVRVTSPSATLLPGETAQLSVVATFIDDTTEDVTPRSAGTTYLSTNSNLLTVTEDGLVTGVNVTATDKSAAIAVASEGNLALVAIRALAAADQFDFDGDGLPNEYEELFGLDPLADDAGADPDNDGLTNLEEFELGTLPNNADTDLDGIPDGLDAQPLVPDEVPPTVIINSPPDGALVYEGQTLLFSVDASDDGLLASVELLVNGVGFGTSTAPPFELTFTVPFDAGSLAFEASALDSGGSASMATSLVAVGPDPLTTVEGNVVDTQGGPVAATVTLELGGLAAEFFDFDQPLSALPDLSGLTPDAVRTISAVNFLNPGGQFSPDTFGVGLAPDFAARFSGSIRIVAAGTHTFFLGVDDGARLIVDGVQVMEVVGSGELTEAQASVDLAAGELPLTIEYFQAVGDAELRLSISGPGGEPRSILGPDDLFHNPAGLSAATDTFGAFSIPDVPSISGSLRAIAATASGSGISPPAVPQPGGTTDVGNIVLASSGTLLGSELQINEETRSTQSEASVAIGPDGGFVVVWKSDPLFGGSDTSGTRIQGRRLASDGTALGEEFQVNDFTVSFQVSPEVSVGPSGDFVVVWESDGSFGDDNSRRSIQARRFTSDGSSVAGQFQVNTYTPSFQIHPSIATATNGDFIIAWETGGDVKAQRYASDGNRIGEEFQVSTMPCAGRRSSIAIGSNGGFVVVWGANYMPVGDDTSGRSIQGQRFAADATRLGDEFLVNTFTSQDQDHPTIDIGPGGDFVVVWHSEQSITEIFDYSIQGQRFAADGSRLGDQFQVNTYTAQDQKFPEVAVKPSGEFVVVWHSRGSSGSDTSFLSYSIQGQRFAADSTRLAGEFQVNTYTTSFQYYPMVAVNPDGGFVVVWTSDGSSSSDNDRASIQGQRFSP